MAPDKLTTRTACAPLITCVVTVALVMGCATEPAVAQSNSAEDQVELTFSSIDVEDRSRQLEVEYRLEDQGWRWARNNEYDLWLTLYAPGQEDDYVFVHGMPLQSARGRVLFPSHVRYYNYSYVGLCVVAVGVGEQFEPGYGYVCDDPVRVNIRERRDVRWSHSRVIFTLGFHSGLYSYPWFHPYYGFYYPSYYYGPYPPRVIIRDGRRRHYHPRHYRRDDYRRDKSDRYDRYDRRRDGRDRYRDARRPTDRRRFEPTRPKTKTPSTTDRRRFEPTRPKVQTPSTPKPQRVTPPRIDPRPRQIQPKQQRQRFEPTRPAPQRVQPRPQQRQRFEPTRPAPQRVQPRPQQIRPQQIRPPQQRQRFAPTPKSGKR